MVRQTSRQTSFLLGACVALVAGLAPTSIQAANAGAPPPVIPSGAGTVAIGPQAMEGNLRIHPGDFLLAGFDFTMPGNHAGATVFLSSAYVSLLVTCADGSSPALAIPLRDQTMVDPAGSTTWYPSGDQSNSVTYQGDLTAPDLCGGGVMDDARGALLTTAFLSTDTVDKYNFRFHYSDHSAGAWSATKSASPAPVAKTVASATLTSSLGLALSRDKQVAIPGDGITYTASLTNTGTALTLTGDLYAAATGTSTATVESYWDDVYLSLNGTNWTILAGTGATASGYVPAMPSPGGTGLTLSSTQLSEAGVTYPSGSDPILGTTIGSHDLARWHYAASAPLTPSEVAALAGPASSARVRNTFHLEVTPANPNVVQPAIVNVEFTGLLASSGSSGALTNLKVTIYPPAGAMPLQFNVASLANGASTSVSGTFTVPPPPIHASGEADASYVAALSALNGAHLNASATASGTANTVLVTAPAPPPVTSIEDVPIVSIVKSGPPSVAAGTTETNPLTLVNTGGATAESLLLVDNVAGGSIGSVSGVPSTLTPGGVAAASATYAVPAAQSWGGLADTASVSWSDHNGNLYGPVSSSFTTKVTPPRGASATGLFGIAPTLEVVVGTDPTTGRVNTVADISSPNLLLGSNLSADPSSHRLFEAELTADLTARLLTIDSVTDAVSITPLSRAIVGLAFDASSGSLYAVTAESAPRHVVRVDPVSGAETDLAAFNGDTWTPVAIDPTTHTFYVISQGTGGLGLTSQLFSLNTETSVLTPGPVLATPVAGLAYDTSARGLFAITAATPSQLVRLDPASGVETPIGGPLGQVEAEIAVDSASNTIYVSQIAAVDVRGNPSDTRIIAVNDVTGSASIGGLIGAEVRALVFLP